MHPNINYPRRFACILTVTLLLCTGCATSPSDPRSELSKSTPGSEGIALPLKKDTGAPDTPTQSTGGSTFKKQFSSFKSTAELSFTNTETFDLRLSQVMRNNNDIIEVSATSGELTVNKIPERLDRWLYQIEKTQGKVEAVPIPSKTRSLEVLAPLIIEYATSAINFFKKKVSERRLYSPSSQFNAYVHYDPQSGAIERIEFKRRSNSK